MSKLKNTRGFTDQFKGILNLSETQINEIDQIEYDKFRTYFWNSVSDKSLKFGFLRSVLKLLDDKQIKALKSYKTDIIYQKKTKEENALYKLIESERIRLSTLNLTENQLLKYAETKINLPKLAREKSIQNAKKGIFLLPNTNILKELENEHLIPIFTEEQSLKYLKIVQEEDLQKLEFNYKMTKQQFEYDYDVKVSDHLVPLIYEIQDNEKIYDDKGEFLSEFEKEQLKLEKFRKILNTDQFHNYLKKYDHRITLLKQNLIETNNKHLIHLERLRETYHYYLNNVLPEKINTRKQLENELTAKEKEIIDKLLKLYLHKIEINKAKALIQHKRFNLDLVPNEWEDYLIHHNFSIVRPNAYLLKGNELVTELLSKELIKKVNTFQSKLKTINKHFNRFQIDLYENSGGEYGGWLMKIPHTSVPNNLEYLSFLLLSPDLTLNLNYTKNV
jgi:hypothetical protein